jgi:lysophospholipase L1-like esterase
VRRALRYLGQIVLVVALGLVLAEALLRAGSFLVRDRITRPRSGARHVVLCAGDSHTFGAGVPAADSYPAHLQAILDAHAPGEYAVVNVGVPGMSTTQVLHRLPDQLRALRPDTVVIWCGINDVWNTSELDEASVGLRRAVREGLRGLRLVRLWQVWRHNERLFRPEEWDRGASVARARVASDSGMNPNRTLTLDWGDRIEHLRFTGVEDAEPDARVAARRAANLEAMVQLVRAAGARVVLITYPLEMGGFVAANRSLRAVARGAGIPLVESERALARVPEDRRQWVLTLHPTRWIYREVARDVARTLLADHRPGAAPPRRGVGE